MIDKSFLNQKVLCVYLEDSVQDILTDKSKLIPGLKLSYSLNQSKNLITFIACK